MMKQQVLLLSWIFLLSLNALAESPLLVQPEGSYFFWHETVVPAESRPLQLLLDLPDGMTLDKEGFINRQFCVGDPCVVPEITEVVPVELEKQPYLRHTLLYRFEQPVQIPLQPKRSYKVKMRLRYAFERGFASVLFRTGDDNGGLVGYSNKDQFLGQADWQYLSYDLHSGEKTHGVIIWFFKDAGEECDGWIELASLEIYEAEQKVPLQCNDFRKSQGGWGGTYKDRIVHNAEQATVKFIFQGAGTTGFTYNEQGKMAAERKIRTAPFFAVKSLAEGKYPVYLREGEQVRTIDVVVDRREPVRLKKLETALWLAESPFQGFSTKAQDALLNTARDAGFNTLYIEGPRPGSQLNYGTDPAKLALPSAEVKELSERGFKVLAYLAFGGSNLGPLNKSFIQQHPEAASITWQNRPSTRLCGTYQMEVNDEIMRIHEDVLKRLMEESPIRGFFWDVESLFPTPSPTVVAANPGPLDGGSACYCERCIKRFKEEYHITDLEKRPLYPYQIPYDYEQIPEPARSILQKCPLEWTHFVLRETVWQVDRLRQVIKSVRQDAEFRVYTGLHTRGYWRFPDGGLLRWSEYCGVDRSRMAKITDGIMGCHDQGFYSDVEAIVLKEEAYQATGEKKPLILDISTQGLYGEVFKNLYPRIIHIFALCEADGVAIWGFWELDAQDFNELRRGLADVARFEEFFTRGRRVDSLHELRSESTLKAATWMSGNQRAVFILNPGKKTADLTLSNRGLQPASRYRYRATFINDPHVPISDPAEIPMEIPPGDVRIILIEDISYPETK